MVAQELRIGNYVMLNKNNSDSEVFQMEAFDIYKVDESDCYDISPIPLTPEVLEACEFKYFDNIEDWGYENDGIRISDFDDYFYMDLLDQQGIDLEIRSAHQLQNLYYAITGKELTIDIDKLKNAVK